MNSEQWIWLGSEYFCANIFGIFVLLMFFTIVFQSTNRKQKGQMCQKCESGLSLPGKAQLGTGPWGLGVSRPGRIPDCSVWEDFYPRSLDGMIVHCGFTPNVLPVPQVTHLREERCGIKLRRSCPVFLFVFFGFFLITCLTPRKWNLGLLKISVTNVEFQ